MPLVMPRPFRAPAGLKNTVSKLHESYASDILSRLHYYPDTSHAAPCANLTENKIQSTKTPGMNALRRAAKETSPVAASRQGFG